MKEPFLSKKEPGRKSPPPVTKGDFKKLSARIRESYTISDEENEIFKSFENHIEEKVQLNFQE